MLLFQIAGKKEFVRRLYMYINPKKEGNPSASIACMGKVAVSV